MDHLGTIIILAIAIVCAGFAGGAMLNWLGAEDGKGAAALAGTVTFVFVARLLQETGDWWERI